MSKGVWVRRKFRKHRFEATDAYRNLKYESDLNESKSLSIHIHS